MIILKTLPFFTVLMVVLLISIPQITYAYLDPTSINFYLQVLAGGLVGIIMGIKFFWGNIKSLFKKIFRISQDSGQSSEK